MALPAKVWEGGPANLAIHVRTNQPARIKMHFGEKSRGGKEGRALDAEQPVNVGESDYTVNVPDGTGVYFELGVPGAKPGASIAASLKVGGREIWNDTSTLEGALGSNEAFFINTDIDDITAK